MHRLFLILPLPEPPPTLLAKRWQSALLVNVDNDTLKRLMASTEAMTALAKYRGFPQSQQESLRVIINKSEAVKKLKKDGVEKLTPKEKKELTEAEKEFKSKRKEVQGSYEICFKNSRIYVPYRLP